MGGGWLASPLPRSHTARMRYLFPVLFLSACTTAPVYDLATAPPSEVRLEADVRTSDGD